jgi:quinol monooxygenase YgiN
MKKNPTTAMVVFKVKPDKVERFLTAADRLIRKSRRQRGCLDYFIHQSWDYANIFMLYMNWADDDAYRRHVASAHIQEFDLELAKELLAEPYIMTRWRHLA